MKLTPSMLEEEVNPEPRQAPEFVMWMPPSGAAVECPSLELAQRAAVKFAARHPGTTVGVYQLIGFAHKPLEEPEFVQTEPTASGPALTIEGSNDRDQQRRSNPRVSELRRGG